MWRALDAQIREHPTLADTGLVHHGGHAIGLRAHEMPDLNRDRGGTLEVGNVVSVEPGGYADALNYGVRIENMYLITESGAENLSEYPMEIVSARVRDAERMTLWQLILPITYKVYLSWTPHEHLQKENEWVENGT